MKFKILILALAVLSAPACIAHIPTPNVVVVEERPVVRIVHQPRPVVRIHHHYPRPVVRHHRHTVRRHHRHTTRCHHRRPRR